MSNSQAQNVDPAEIAKFAAMAEERLRGKRLVNAAIKHLVNGTTSLEEVTRVVGSDVGRVDVGAVLSVDSQPLVGGDDQGTSYHVSDSFHVS